MPQYLGAYRHLAHLAPYTHTKTHIYSTVFILLVVKTWGALDLDSLKTRINDHVRYMQVDRKRYDDELVHFMSVSATESIEHKQMTTSELLLESIILCSELGLVTFEGTDIKSNIHMHVQTLACTYMRIICKCVL